MVLTFVLPFFGPNIQKMYGQFFNSFFHNGEKGELFFMLRIVGLELVYP